MLRRWHASTAGAYLYFTTLSDETRTTAIAPYITGDEVGRAVSGEF